MPLTSGAIVVLALLALLATADAIPAEKLVLRSRNTTFTGAALIGAGTPMVIGGFQGSGGAVVAGSTMLGLGGTLFIGGTLAEAAGLHRLTGVSTAVGWTGLAMMSVAGSATVGILVGGSSTAALVVGSSLGGVGFILIIAQASINVRNGYAMGVSERLRVYRPHRVAMTVTPTVREGGGGLALVGVW